MSNSFSSGRVWGSAQHCAGTRLAVVFALAASALVAGCGKSQGEDQSAGGARPANAGASGTDFGWGGSSSPSNPGGANSTSGMGGISSMSGAGAIGGARASAGMSSVGGSAGAPGAMPTAGAGFGSFVPSGLASIFPLSVASNHRYLKDSKGVPFPILGDAGWEVSHNTDYAAQRVYVEDRVARGFNSMLAVTIDHKSTLNKPPRDYAGNLPFSMRLDGQAYTGSPNGTNSANGNSLQFSADPYKDVNAEAPDFTYPTVAYWAQQDGYIWDCASSGVAVFLFPAYVGFAGGDEGWMNEMVANDAITGAGGFAMQPWADATKSKLWNYGAWLAQHYATTPNIVWVLGGDFGTGPNGVFSPTQAQAVNNLAAGMKSVAGHQSTLWTAHWARPSLGTDLTQFSALLDLQSVYVDASAAAQTRAAYAASPTMPTFEIEDYYEGDPAGAGEPNRRYQWWSFLGSIAGQFSGNSKLWQFPTDWQSQLDSTGARDMAIMNSIIRSIPWQDLVPSGLGGTKQIVTANGGVAGEPNYIACAGSSSTVVCYVPPAWALGTFSIDSTVLSGPYRARWFDPTSPSWGVDGDSIPNTGTHTFKPRGNNATSFADWVLVLDQP